MTTNQTKYKPQRVLVREERDRLLADNARLREALRQMICAHGNDESWWETEGEHRYQNQIDDERLPYPTADVIRQQITDEARAALAKHTVEDGKVCGATLVCSKCGSTAYQEDQWQGSPCPLYSGMVALRIQNRDERIAKLSERANKAERDCKRLLKILRVLCIGVPKHEDYNDARALVRELLGEE